MRTIYFDMDGTIANLYGVSGWLADLQNENTRPYEQATVLLNMQALARVLNRLQKQGYAIGVISWLSRNGSNEYNERITQVKKEWLNRHLHSVNFDYIHIVEYGTPKSNFANSDDILFDDELPNRQNFVGTAYDVDNILEILKSL